MRTPNHNVPLAMSVGDIVNNYRQAKNKRNQIDILADLNDTSPARIAWLLDQAGCEVPIKKLPVEGSKLIDMWMNSDEAEEARAINLRMHPPKPVQEPEPVPAEKQEAKPTIEELDETKRSAASEELNATDLSAAIAGFWNTYLIFRLEFPMRANARSMLTGKDVQRMLELAEMAREMMKE